MNLPRVPSLRVVRRVVKLLLIEDLLLLQFVELDLLRPAPFYLQRQIYVRYTATVQRVQLRDDRSTDER